MTALEHACGYPGSVNEARFRLSDMEFDFVSLVARGDDPMARVVLSKADPDDVTTQEDLMPEIKKDDLDPQVVAYIDALEDETDRLSKSVEDLQKSLDEASVVSKSDEDVQKELLAKADPGVRALIEKQQADMAALQEIAKKEREERLTREYVSKAEAMPMLNEGTDDLAGLLRRTADALSARGEDGTKDVEKWETLLKAANEQIAQGNLFGEFGSSHGQSTISKSVEAQAEALRKAEPTLTQDQAIAKVYEQNPGLLAEAMKED